MFKSVSKIKKSQFLRVMSFMKPRIWRYGIGMIGMTVLFSTLTLVETFTLKYVVESVELRSISLLLRGISISVVLIIIINVLMPRTRFMYNGSAHITVADVKKAVFKHRESLALSYFEKTHSGDIISRLVNDVSLMCELYTARIRRLIAPIMFGVTAAIPMFILNWRISSVLMLLNLLCAFINFKYISPMRRVSDKIQKNESKMTQNLIDMLAGFQIMKIFGIEKYILNKYFDANDMGKEFSLERVHMSSTLDSINYAMRIISTLGVVLAGLYLVSKDMTTFGTIFAIVSLQGRLNEAFLQVANYLPQVQKMLSGSSRVFEFLDTDGEPEYYNADFIDKNTGIDKTDSIKIASNENNECKVEKDSVVSMKDVEFSYDISDKGEKVLKGFCLDAGKGQTIALVGPSGQGKSTVVKLILGFYPINNGSIYINGESISNYKLKRLREMIAYVPQDPYLYDDTIMENIRHGQVDASDEEVMLAAKAAFAHDFIMLQPERYATVVGERGVKLSGGQKQRIAIARALLKNAPILLLDEATSSLDSESEVMVQKALQVLRENRTTIAIAHRLSTIEDADVIYVVDDGRVIEKGNHSELLCLNGQYCQLHKTQFAYN